MNNSLRGAFRIGLYLALVLLAWTLPAQARTDSPRPWSLTVFGAKQTQVALLDIFANQHYLKESYLGALAVAREFARTGDDLAWEVEGQVVKHFGKQHNWELNTLVVARWHRFPWDRYLDTSAAVGEGLSLASRTPGVETEDHDNTSPLLNYLLFEVAVELPELSQWHFVVRIHHRSGIYGLINNVHGASNFLGTGVKYVFD